MEYVRNKNHIQRTCVSCLCLSKFKLYYYVHKIIANLKIIFFFLIKDQAWRFMDVPVGGLCDVTSSSLQIVGEKCSARFNFTRTKSVAFNWKCITCYKFEK